MIRNNDNRNLYNAFGVRLQMNSVWESSSSFPYQEITIELNKNSLDSCKNILKIAKMYNKNIWLIRHAGGDLWGDKYCYTGKNCLKNVLLHEINDFCNVCHTTGCHFMLAWR